ncbi:class I adenylate-forming enzyme family protein [Microbacterium sp. KHB019]|uniref:class I adenylate-forming enzyme family protein n=1 Tax=Microbacterium sp. KHB019 TaxID=3129770 RepID=UPI00307B0090
MERSAPSLSSGGGYGWASLVRAHRLSNRIALTAGPDQLTYADWCRRGDELAAALLASGLRRGARVGMLLPNGIDFVVTLYACARAGLTAVPISTWAAPGELARIVAAAQPDLMIASDAFVEPVAALAKLAAQGIGPGEEALFVIGEERAGTAHWSALIARGAECDPRVWVSETGADHDDADFVILFTSGSTGDPKGVVLTQGAVRRNAVHISDRMGLGSADRVYSYFPMFFSGGLCNVLSGAAAAGAEIVTQARYEPTTAAGLIRARGCTAHNVWHDGLSAIAGSAGFTTADLRRMRRGLVLDPDLFERFGLPFDQGVNMYGSTETATAFTCHDWQDHADIRRSTHGSPLPGNRLRIVDPDTRTILRDGEVGEIVVRGPNLMRGYTDGSHLGLLDDGWFSTGDLGSWSGGQLLYSGRLKTLIKVKGLTVQPEEVESALRRHEAVAQVVVVGVGGDESTSLRALVSIDATWSAGSDARKIGEILDAHCRRELSSYKIPRIHIVPDADIPLAGSHKLDRVSAARLAARL